MFPNSNHTTERLCATIIAEAQQHSQYNRGRFQLWTSAANEKAILLSKIIMYLKEADLEPYVFAVSIYTFVQKEFKGENSLKAQIIQILSESFHINPIDFTGFIYNEQYYYKAIGTIRSKLLPCLYEAQEARNESEEIYARLLLLFPNFDGKPIDTHPLPRLLFRGYLPGIADLRPISEIPLALPEYIPTCLADDIEVPQPKQRGKYFLGGILSISNTKQLIQQAIREGRESMVFFSLRSPIEAYDQSGKKLSGLVICQNDLNLIMQHLDVAIPEGFQVKFMELSLDDHTPRDYYTGEVIATDKFLSFVYTIEQAIQNGNVHVACWSGMERSVVTTATYFHLYQGMDIPNALAHVKQYRGIAKDLDHLKIPFIEFLFALQEQIATNRPF